MKTLKEHLDHEEKKYLVGLMKTSKTNTEVARKANTSRTQLFRLLEKHGLERISHANERSDHTDLGNVGGATA